MDRSANRVFIFYRRDDAAGYAGRLEEELEKRLGHGSVFRDVLDIPPGEDFVAAIRARLAGTATFLSHPRAIEKLEVDGSNLRFETHTQQTMGNETRELTHRYSAELRGQPPDERLALRMQTSGAFQGTPPLEFDARRVAPAVASSPAVR